MLTIPKDYLLLLVLAALVVSSTLGLILAVANQIHTLWSFSFILLLSLPHIKTLSIDSKLQQISSYDLLTGVS